MTSIDPAVTDQLDSIEIRPSTPLIICDVDEVVVHFLRGLEDYLERQGHWLDATSFALNGNIKSRETNEPTESADVSRLLLEFFDSHTHELDLIDGAHEGLRALEGHADIVLLTNLPPRYLDARTENLRGHGFEYPIIANIGPKGPTVKTMLHEHSERVLFLDDSPSNILSVAEYTPQVNLVHFLQDERLSQVVSPLEEAHFRTDKWTEVVTYVTKHLS